jgi:hypothetical protein
MHIAATESVSLCERIKKLTAFVELESAICACGELWLTGWRDFSKLGIVKPI